jgi:hypothetical protein
MGYAVLPEWENRTEPIFQISDLAPDRSHYDDVVHALQETPEAGRYAADLNEARRGLYDALRQRVLPYDLYFYTQKIQELSADIVGVPPYPGHRLTVEPLRPGKEPSEIAVFDPRLGVIAIAEHYRTQDSLEVVDAVARNAGQAALSPVLDVSSDHLTTRYRVDTGTVWHDGDRTYGRLLGDAVAVRIAALVRKELNLADRSPDIHPVLAPYSRPRGYTAADIMAAGLDLINRKAGFMNDMPGLYGALWGYAAAGRSNDARSAVTGIIKHAAAGGNSGLTLEALELDPERPGLPIGLLHRIEEAVGMDVSARPSSVFV